MRVQQRAPWLEKVATSYAAYRRGERTGYVVLCSFCRFFRVWPPGYEESYDDAECTHPLATSKNLDPPDYGLGPIPTDRAFDGGDCWGFRPTQKAREQLRQ
jgi:hypothetical protein